MRMMRSALAIVQLVAIFALPSSTAQDNILLANESVAPSLRKRSYDLSALLTKQAPGEFELRLTKRLCELVDQYSEEINIIYSVDACLGVDTVSRIEKQLFMCLSEFQTLHLSINITEGKQEPHRGASSLNVYLITPEDPSHTECKCRILEFIDSLQTQKFRHKYIFVWPNATDTNVKEFLEILWERKQLLHILVITDHERIFSFFPFSEHGFKLYRFRKSATNLFYDKLTNFYGKELNISMFKDYLRAIPRSNAEWEGFESVDGILAEIVTKKLNATAHYILPADNANYGDCINGSVTGVITDLVSGRTQIGFNARFTLECHKALIEELYPFRRRYFFLVLPAAQARPGYLIFINVFKNSLWCLLLFNFLAIVVIFYALQRLLRFIPTNSRETQKSMGFFQIFDFFFKTQLGEPVEGFSKISSLRQFLMSWILFSYVLTTIYFAKLESSFVRPVYEESINSLDELHRLNIPVFAVKTLYQSLSESLETKYWKHIERNAKRLPLNYSASAFALHFVNNLKLNNVGFLLRADFALELFAKTYDNVLGRPRVHIVKQHVKSTLQTYVVPNGSPFRSKFETIISRLYECGIIDYLAERDTLSQNKETELPSDEDSIDLDDLDSFDGSESKQDSRQKHKHVALSLDVLQGGFFLWVIGIIISCFGFASEIAYYIYFNRPSKRYPLFAHATA